MILLLSGVGYMEYIMFRPILEYNTKPNVEALFSNMVDSIGFVESLF